MPWLLLATLGADWWSPVRVIEQSDPVKEGHLAQLLDFFTNLHLYFYLYLGRSSVGATCLLVLPVTTYGASPLLLPWALLRFMAPLVTFGLHFIHRYVGLHCFFLTIPTPKPCTIRSQVLLVYNMILRLGYIRYDLLTRPCTISISEPPLLRYLGLGELRSLST